MLTSKSTFLPYSSLPPNREMIRRHRAEIRAEIPALRTPQGAGGGHRKPAVWWDCYGVVGAAVG